LAALALAARVCLAQNVTIHLTATDSQGHPVTDLAADELRLTDEGRPQPIGSFRKDAARFEPPTAGEFTNRPAALAGVHIILFDLLNLPVADRKPCTDQIVRTFQHLEQPESVYLYVLSVEGQVIPVRGLPAAAPIPAAPANADLAAAFDKAVGPVAAQRANFTTDVAFRSKNAYAALETLAGRLASIPGRKTISWITMGIPRTFQRGASGAAPDVRDSTNELFDSLPYIRQTANRVAQAGVGINPVAMLSGADSPENRETLQAFAELTGGKLYQSGDIERAVPEIIQDSRVTFRVQYTPKSWDGKFHKLRVTSARKGVNIQCEQGFIAEKPSDPATIYQSPFDAADIGVRSTVTPGAQANVLRLHLNIDSQDIHLEGPVQLTLSVAGYMPDGKMITYAPVPLNLNLTPEQREKAKDGLRLGHEVTVATGMQKVRLAIEDRATKTSGTLTIPVGN
jgi:VWFA-related protein